MNCTNDNFTRYEDNVYVNIMWHVILCTLLDLSMYQFDVTDVSYDQRCVRLTHSWTVCK